MYTNYMRQEQIKGTLERYLTQIDAKPTAGQVQLFYVQALVGDKGYVELKDFQYLTHGKTTVDAMRESFALGGAPGTEDRLDRTGPGMRLEGIYVTAYPEGEKFEIRGGPLTKDFYAKIHQEGMALRDQRAKERAEAQRIQALRDKHVSDYAAGDPAARARLQRDLARKPLPPGPVIFPSGAPAGRGDATSMTPTRSGPQPTMTATPFPSVPIAHPRVPFNAPSSATPPAPVQTQPLH